ncbi:MAG: hypothetical protein C0615_07325 [Desulfuromonas sp.]|nr:MAG: hypothetical protein C0615_07325 [Desulfuromonas sp.]
MIRLLLFALFFYLCYTLLNFILRSFAAKSMQPPEKTADGEAMVRDPQCGTYVPRGDAIAKTIRGEHHYFCSEACRDEYSGKEKS